ncbi:tripartite tricarboxylate transporter TctB family protein [Ruegeria halocynthiae]|uniref:tripartite tricarboxylate transporter TctB family protein n=1 Tax=Ruegeria halocynthiae TaxID=985054 RepID=UPI000568B35C|nr:tripartite tricarboxylate transporter TctB family protein [Ruegeria halocynthiae]
MTNKKTKDLITAILFIVSGLAAIFALIPSGVIVPGSVQISALSPDFWPYTIAWGVVISSAFLLLETFMLKVPEGDEDATEDAEYKLETLPSTLRIVILIFALFLFYFALTTVGIVAGSIVLMPTMMLYFGERKWKYIVPLSILIPIGLYLFFLHVAGIPMPLGIFETLL